MTTAFLFIFRCEHLPSERRGLGLECEGALLLTGDGCAVALVHEEESAEPVRRYLQSRVLPQRTEDSISF